MNIVKIKDVILDNTSGLSEDELSVYNQYMRGRYVYCINWTYCVPLEEIDISKYIEISQQLQTLNVLHDVTDNPIVDNDNSLPSIQNIFEDIHYIALDTIQNYVDDVETLQINDVTKYLAFNSFTPSEITVDQLKKFRTWLATTILSFGTIEDYEVLHMLTYYKDGMYDDVVKALTVFGGNSITPQLTKSTCGCNNNPVVQINGVMSCDPLYMYRLNIYNSMVKIFSNKDFWMDFDPEFLTMFKAYIDNILLLGFTLTPSVYVSDFADCTCRLDSTNGQAIQQERLKKLSNALSMIIEGNTQGHNTYITNAFSDWAKFLYEKMEW